MNNRFRFPFRTAALAIALAAGMLAAAPAGAAPRDFDPDAPSYVDIGRVLAEYRKTGAFARYSQRIREQARVYSGEMETLAQLRYCTEAERKEALTIKAKPKATEGEKDRLAELTKKSEGIDNEAATLSQKQKPTEADTKRIQEIARIRTDAMKSLAKEEADRRDQLRKLESDMLTEVEGELLKLVEKTAKDMKLPSIYERRAVLFGGNDLTDEVLKKLPK